MKLNFPLILLVAIFVSLAGCKTGGGESSGNGSVAGDTTVFDQDGDGIPDNEDSCPDTVNSGVDQDADGIDDACDTDILASDDVDGDGVLNGEDNCLTVANAGQENVDSDLRGDACDTDADGDGVSDKTDNGDGTFTDNNGDNCPLVANSSQADQDGDGIGNACDGDIDGDGLGNDSDTCPYVNDATNDPASCAADADGDGIPDGTDNCPADVNSDQEDLDNDGAGDVCDTDTDGDGIDNVDFLGQPLDNCPLVANADQADTDGDGIGDACDAVNDADYACAVSGEQFVPMLASDSDINAVASEDASGCLLGLGLICAVENPGNVVDDTLTNVATIRNTDLLGLSTITLNVEATSGFAYPATNALGVAFSESPQTLQADLLGGSLIVRTLLNGVVQEESNGDGIIDLDLLGASGLLGGAETSFLVFQTDLRFDAVEVTFDPSLLSLLNEVNVSAVCASKTELTLP